MICMKYSFLTEYSKLSAEDFLKGIEEIPNLTLMEISINSNGIGFSQEVNIELYVKSGKALKAFHKFIQSNLKVK